MNMTCVVLVAFPVTRNTNNILLVNVNALMMASYIYMCVSEQEAPYVLNNASSTEVCPALWYSFFILGYLKRSYYVFLMYLKISKTIGLALQLV